MFFVVAIFLFLAFFYGAVAGLLGAIPAIILFFPLLPVIFTLVDFRIGVVMLILLTTFQNTIFLPSFTGFNVMNYLTVTTLASLLFARATGKITLVPLPRFIWFLYLVPIFIATAYGYTQLERVPYWFYQVVPSYETTKKYVMDLAVRPLFLVLLAWMVGVAARNSKRPERFLIPMFIVPVMAAASVLVFIPLMGVDLRFLASSSPVARSLLDRIGLHPNELSLVLATGVAIQLFSFSAVHRMYGRILLLIAMAMSATALILTFSRGGYVLMAVVIGYYLVVHRKFKESAFMLAGMAILAAVFAEPLWDRITTGMSALGSGGYRLGIGTGYGASGADELTASRIGIWAALWPDVLRSPILGSGLASVGWSEAVAQGRIAVGHAHSLYMDIVLDLGLAGLILILAFYRRLLLSFRTLYRNNDLPPMLARAFQGIFAAFIGYLVAGVANGNYISNETQTFIWLMFGVSLAYPGKPAAGSAAVDDRDAGTAGVGR